MKEEKTIHLSDLSRDSLDMENHVWNVIEESSYGNSWLPMYQESKLPRFLIEEWTTDVLFRQFGPDQLCWTGDFLIMPNPCDYNERTRAGLVPDFIAWWVPPSFRKSVDTIFTTVKTVGREAVHTFDKSKVIIPKEGDISSSSVDKSSTTESKVDAVDDQPRKFERYLHSFRDLESRHLPALNKVKVMAKDMLKNLLGQSKDSLCQVESLNFFCHFPVSTYYSTLHIHILPGRGACAPGMDKSGKETSRNVSLEDIERHLGCHENMTTFPCNYTIGKGQGLKTLDNLFLLSSQCKVTVDLNSRIIKVL